MVGHRLSMPGWQQQCPSALGPYQPGYAGWLCTASLSRHACGIDAVPLLVSLGAVAVHSVLCSSASVFYNGNIQL